MCQLVKITQERTRMELIDRRLRVEAIHERLAREKESAAVVRVKVLAAIGAVEVRFQVLHLVIHTGVVESLLVTRFKFPVSL